MERREVFGKILYEEMVKCTEEMNSILPKIRGTRITDLTTEEIEHIGNTINILKEHWSKFGRVCHMAEDPVE